MTVSTNAGFDTNAAAPVAAVLSFVRLYFGSGTLYLTTWPVDLTVAAQVYTGLGLLAGIGPVRESEDGSVQRLTLSLSQVSASVLGLALGNLSNYQGLPVQIDQAVADANLASIGTPVMRFSGYMDTVAIKRGSGGTTVGGGGTGSVELECVAGGVQRKNAASYRINDGQHQQRHPGERGFEYTPDLIGRPQLWLSKRFQIQ